MWKSKGTISTYVWPVVVVVVAIVLVWILAAIYLNTPFQKDQYQRAKTQDVAFTQLVKDTLNQERPVLPAPHQVAVEVYKTTVEKKITSKRSLIYHSGITLSTALLGFVIGTLLGLSLIHI